MSVHMKANLNIKSIRIEVDTLFAFVGFVTLAAATLGLFLFMPNRFQDYLPAFYIQAICALTLIVAFAILYHCSEIIGKDGSIPLFVVGGIGLISLIFVVAFPTRQVFLTVFFLVVAIAGIASISIIWFSLMCKLRDNGLVLFVSLGFSTSLVLCLILCMMFYLLAFAWVVIFYAASLICALSVVVLYPKSLVCLISNKESDKRSKIHISSSIMLTSTFFNLGFVIVQAYAVDALSQCLGVACIAAILIFIDSLLSGYLTERRITPMARPLEVLAYMLFFAFDGSFKVLSLCLLSVLLTIYMVLGLTAMAAHVNLSKMSPIRTFSRWRSMHYLGLLLGAGAAYCVMVWDATQAGMLIVCITFVICALSLVSYKPRYPEMGFDTETDEPTQENARGTWNQRCKSIARRYKLSDRQQEILMLIANGRNAKYIEQELTISLSTVQTHIRNIYRKLGIHSRQELIDMIEDEKLFGEN